MGQGLTVTAKEFENCGLAYANRFTLLKLAISPHFDVSKWT
jgi:hypothetical protein